MHRSLQYTLLFVVLIVLQIFLFGRLDVSIYVNPLVYIAFIILLPMEIPGAALLLLGFLAGVTMDFFTGMAGVNTIATVFAAFCRPVALNYIVGKDEVKEGGIPNVNSVGLTKFMRYAGIIVFLHSAVYFILESLSWSYFHHVLIRIALSSVVCLIAVYFVQKFFAVNRQKFRAKSS